MSSYNSKLSDRSFINFSEYKNWKIIKYCFIHRNKITPKINRSDDCGNSPKNKFIEELSIAFITGDIGFIEKSITEAAKWKIIGRTIINGKVNIINEISNNKEVKINELSISHVVTHGKSWAVNGFLKLSDKTLADFCMFFEFTGAKGDLVKEINTYLILQYEK